MPNLRSVLETSLYVDDLHRAAAFYEDIFELNRLHADQRMRAYAIGKTVLLLFPRGQSATSLEMPNGTIPPHDGHGSLHIAFAVEERELPSWERRLAAAGVQIEGRMRWPRGGTSIYFRDPDRHLLELATPGLWANY